MLATMAGDKWISVKDASRVRQLRSRVDAENLGTDKMVSVEAPKVTASSSKTSTARKAFSTSATKPIEYRQRADHLL